MTVVMRFPKGYLTKTPVPLSVMANNCVIDSVFSDFALRNDGVVEVEERLYLNVVTASADFVRSLERSYFGPMFPEMEPGRVQYEMLESTVHVGSGHHYKAYESVSGYEADASDFKISIPGSNFPEPGMYVVTLKYRIWGATRESERGLSVYLPWLNPDDHEPIAVARCLLHWDQPARINLGDVGLKDTAPGSGKVTLDSTYLEMEFPENLKAGQAGSSAR